MRKGSMATPFIGALISLVSKAEVRYEGTLYSIDPVKATVALQNGEPFRCPFFSLPSGSSHAAGGSEVVWHRGAQAGRGAAAVEPRVRVHHLPRDGH